MQDHFPEMTDRNEDHFTSRLKHLRKLRAEKQTTQKMISSTPQKLPNGEWEAKAMPCEWPNPVQAPGPNSQDSRPPEL